MTIKITQSCDGVDCTNEREIEFGYYGQPRDMRAAADRGNWREVTTGKHLCPDCIKKATGQ